MTLTPLSGGHTGVSLIRASYGHVEYVTEGAEGGGGVTVTEVNVDHEQAAIVGSVPRSCPRETPCDQMAVARDGQLPQADFSTATGAQVGPPGWRWQQALSPAHEAACTEARIMLGVSAMIAPKSAEKPHCIYI